MPDRGSIAQRAERGAAPWPGAASVLIAGVAALAAWEAFARLLAPLWLGFVLDPAGLVSATFGVSGWQARAVHLLTAVLLYPLAYAVVVRPLLWSLWPGLPWIVLGVGYGVALWAVALAGIAPVLAGMPLFLGFQPAAWASLAGHVLMALAIAGVIARRSARVS